MCKKISITNAAPFQISFSYQECSDTQWRYQTELDPGQKKEIYSIDNTLYIPTAFEGYTLIDEEIFPPTPSNTRTNEPTPTPTPTVTPTPSEVPSSTLLYRADVLGSIPPIQGALYSDSFDNPTWIGTDINVYFDDEGYDSNLFEFVDYSSFWDEVISNISLGVEYEISFKNTASFQLPTPNTTPSIYQVNSATNEGGYYKLELTLLNGIEYMPSRVGGSANFDEIKLFMYN